jgi:hypothetical protein
MVSFTPLPLYLRGNNPQYALYRVWVGPRDNLNFVEKTEISCSYRKSNPDSSDFKPVA